MLKFLLKNSLYAKDVLQVHIMQTSDLIKFKNFDVFAKVSLSVLFYKKIFLKIYFVNTNISGNSCASVDTY